MTSTATDNSSNSTTKTKNIADCNRCEKYSAENKKCRVCKLIFYCSDQCREEDAQNHSNYCRAYPENHVKCLLEAKQTIYSFTSNKAELLLIWKDIMSEEFKTKGRGVIKIDLNHQFDHKSIDSGVAKQLMGPEATGMKGFPWTYVSHDHEAINNDKPIYEKLRYLIQNYDPTTQLVIQVINFLPEKDENQNQGQNAIPAEQKKLQKRLDRKNKKKKNINQNQINQSNQSNHNNDSNNSLTQSSNTINQNNQNTQTKKTKFIHLETVVNIDFAVQNQIRNRMTMSK